MNLVTLIKRLETVLEEHGNMSVSINGYNLLNNIVLYDEMSAPETADDYDGYPVEVSLED